MDLNLTELRADVREALAAGRERVELIYATEDEFQAAIGAMRADGHRVTEHRFGGPGGCVIVRAAEAP